MKRIKNILLIGGRSKAKSMAISLLKQGYKVTAINSNYEDCKSLAEINGLNVIHGDGTKAYILDEANAEMCDIAIALSSKDADNLIACQLCKKLYKIKKTVSLVSDPNKMSFFYQMGIDSVVCAVSAVTNIIQQQALIDEMSNIIPIGEGRVQIAEVKVLAESQIAGKKLWEISFPQEAIVGCVLRGDSFLIPRGDTRILAGDILVVLVGNEQDLNTVYDMIGR